MKNIATLKRNFAIIIIALTALFTVTSCDKSDEVITVSYYMGIGEYSSDDMYALTELYYVEGIFCDALGVDSNAFTVTGTLDDCNDFVLSACEEAATTLNSYSWTSTFTYIVENLNTGEVIYTYDSSESTAN